MKINQTKHDHRVVGIMPANLTKISISNETNYQQKHHYLQSGGDDHACQPRDPRRCNPGRENKAATGPEPCKA